MKFIIIRHAESNGNKEHIIQGTNDIYTITQNGINECLAMLKKNNKQLELVDKVYCSKLIRAKQTCEIIASSIHFKGEIIYTSLLNEMNPGVISGMQRDKVKIKYPNYYNLWMARKDLDGIPGAETGEELQVRCLAFLQNFIEDTETNNTYLVVTHAGYMRCLINICNGNERIRPVNVGNLSLHVIENPWNNIKHRCLKRDKRSSVYIIELHNKKYILKRYRRLITSWDIEISHIENKVAAVKKNIPKVYWIGKNKGMFKIMEYMKGNPIIEMSYITLQDIKIIIKELYEINSLYNEFNEELPKNKHTLYEKILRYMNNCKDKTLYNIGILLLENKLIMDLLMSEQKLCLYDMHNLNVLHNMKEFCFIDLDSVVYAPKDYQIASFLSAFCLLNNVCDKEYELREILLYSQKFGYCPSNIISLLIIRAYTGIIYFSSDFNDNNKEYIEKYKKLIYKSCMLLEENKNILGRDILNIIENDWRDIY